MNELQPHVKILELSQISPPSPAAVPTTPQPLTFLDYPWLYCNPVERLFFYDYPYTTSHFTQTTLPLLKHSLSLALHRFFPLAATLPCSPPPTIIKPYLLYTPGDYVPLAVAESSADFNRLILHNHPDDSALLHPLVPSLEDARETHGNGNGPPGFSCSIPLAAIQLTVFPDSGICIGLQWHHVACDGKSVVHFMKTWASICRNGGDLAAVDQEPPFHGREMLKFPNNLELILLDKWSIWSSSWQDKQKSPSPSSSLPALIIHKMRATFVLSKFQISKLKQWILAKINCNNVNTLNHVSTFVAVCAFTWSCLVKAEVNNVTTNPLMSVKNDDNMEKKCYHHFGILVDCRNRLELQGSIVPITYFGNALSPAFVDVERSVLIGQYGIVSAAKAIADKVEELKTGLLVRAEAWWSDYEERLETGYLSSVAGSPLFRVYDTDFGWGRPRKSQVVHIDSERSVFALGDSRDEEGGVEIGIALNQPSMDAFVSIFQQTLKMF